jgi:alginate O-acetyltransferase complex protein AlgI
VYLTANQAWRHFRQRIPNASAATPPTGARRFAMMIGVYMQVTFALVFFRSSSTHAAFALLQDIAGAHGIGSLGSLAEGALAFALFPVVWFMPNTQQILGQERSTVVPIPGPAAPTTLAHEQTPSLFPKLRWCPSLGWGLAMAALFFAVLVELGRPAAFLYFQF